jgi:hypothetical protein
MLYGYYDRQAMRIVRQAQAQAQAAFQAAMQPQAPPLVPKLGTEPEEGDMLNNFLIGCDPEFILLDNEGKTAKASQYFPYAGLIGYDHGGRVAELRPKPAKGTYTVLLRLQELIQSKPVIAVPHRLRAGAICNNDCLGGHVHLGFNGMTSGQGTFLGGQLNEKGAQVTKALDALTKVLEHLDILPKNECAKRRNSAQAVAGYYGAYGDVRDSNGHMEYRTMASWLYDPKVAFLCLTAAKLAAVDPKGAYEALQDCTSWKGLKAWLDSYRSKDVNAKRLEEKITDLKKLQVDPTVNFRERWENLEV